MADKLLNLTVIGDRACSTTRTYLEYLDAAGFRVQRLWLVDFIPQKPRSRSLSRLLKNTMANALIKLRKKTSGPDVKTGAAYRALCMRLQKEAGFTPIDYFAAWRPEAFAEETTEFQASDFTDPRLQARMRDTGGTAFLFTNGGIVPGSLLNEPGIRVIHVHPGIVPDLRGSDCLLWSAAVRKKLGVSCFYMSAGIDEGALLGQREFSLPKLPSLAPLMNSADEPLAYRALLYAVDPHLRGNLLVDVLRANPGADLRNLPARDQPIAARPAYLWMHPRLRLRTMREAFL